MGSAVELLTENVRKIRWVIRERGSEGFPHRPSSITTLSLSLSETLYGWRVGANRVMLDHVVVLGERHLRQVLRSYMAYHNEARTHLSLNKDAPVPREVQGVGRIIAKPHIGGLHHQYVRI